MNDIFLKQGKGLNALAAHHYKSFLYANPQKQPPPLPFATKEQPQLMTRVGIMYMYSWENSVQTQPSKLLSHAGYSFSRSQEETFTNLWQMGKQRLDLCSKFIKSAVSFNLQGLVSIPTRKQDI